MFYGFRSYFGRKQGQLLHIFRSVTFPTYSVSGTILQLLQENPTMNNKSPSLNFRLQLLSLVAQELGFEPRQRLLESRMLPLHHSHKMLVFPSSQQLSSSCSFSRSYSMDRSVIKAIVLTMPPLSHQTWVVSKREPYFRFK